MLNAPGISSSRRVKFRCRWVRMCTWLHCWNYCCTALNPPLDGTGGPLVVHVCRSMDAESCTREDQGCRHGLVHDGYHGTIVLRHFRGDRDSPRFTPGERCRKSSSFTLSTRPERGGSSGLYEAKVLAILAIRADPAVRRLSDVCHQSELACSEPSMGTFLAPTARGLHWFSRVPVSHLLPWS